MGGAIGKSKRQALNEPSAVPGPGSYQTPMSLAGKNWSMVGRKPNANVDQGGNMYDVRGQPNGPRWGFGSEKRSKLNRNSNPGPGSYQIKSTIGRFN